MTWVFRLRSQSRSQLRALARGAGAVAVAVAVAVHGARSMLPIARRHVLLAADLERLGGGLWGRRYLGPRKCWAARSDGTYWVPCA